jgi:hypothetical protein
MRLSCGGANLTPKAIEVVWLTGVSISLNEVSGRSTRGTTNMKTTAVIRRNTNIRPIRFTTNAPQVAGTYCSGSSLSSISSTIELVFLSSTFYKEGAGVHPDSVRTAADPKFRYADTSGVHYLWRTQMYLENSLHLRFSTYTPLNVDTGKSVVRRRCHFGSTRRELTSNDVWVCGWADISNFVRL